MVNQAGDNWKVIGSRTGDNVKPPVLTISTEYLLTVDEVKNRK
jgi:hypothetical protein